MKITVSNKTKYSEKHVIISHFANFLNVDLRKDRFSHLLHR